MADHELGAFLRSRRESVDLADVADLAGISVDELDRLERGLDGAPSPQVLASLADALRLTAEDRYRLLVLSRQQAADALLCPSTRERVTTIRPTIRAVLDRLEPTPAMVINLVGDILAWTSGGARLFGPTGFLDGSSPNISRYIFTDPRAREVLPDWAKAADMALNQLRQGPHPAVSELIEEMSQAAGASFTELLAHPMGPASNFGDLTVRHPIAGTLRLAYETLDLSIVGEQLLIVCLPADEPTRNALTRLEDDQG